MDDSGDGGRGLRARARAARPAPSRRVSSPSTGIVSPEGVVHVLRRLCDEAGVLPLLVHGACAASRVSDHLELETDRERIAASVVVNAAGLYADLVSEMLGRRGVHDLSGPRRVCGAGAAQARPDPRTHLPRSPTCPGTVSGSIWFRPSTASSSSVRPSATRAVAPTTNPIVSRSRISSRRRRRCCRGSPPPT